jgi:hypothetical protein
MTISSAMYRLASRGPLRHGAWMLSGCRTTRLRPSGRVSRLSSPCGKVHRAGLTGRRTRGTCSVLRCSRLGLARRPCLRDLSGMIREGTTPPRSCSSTGFKHCSAGANERYGSLSELRRVGTGHDVQPFKKALDSSANRVTNPWGTSSDLWRRCRVAVQVVAVHRASHARGPPPLDRHRRRRLR